MIELITSLTPRVTLRTATMPAQQAPTTIATTTINRTCSGPGRATAAPAAAATIVASRYWPSTPMLNRPMRKATATASPARNSGIARLTTTTIAVTCCDGVSPKSSMTSKTPNGFTCSAAMTSAEMSSATTSARTGGEERQARRRRSSGHAAPAVVCAPVMCPPSSSGVTRRGVEGGDQPAAQHHVQGVRQADQLVEVGGDQQDAQPLGAGVLEQLPDRRLRADVDAAGRVRRDEQPRARRSSRGRR